tara:strand:- start:45 stop:581 length:537 start_codon:yes stop_codon:yes gene_type:complete
MFKSLIRTNSSVLSQEVIQHIYENLDKFDSQKYKWVNKSGAGYEKEICKLLNWKCVNGRHWDCETESDIKIELKKSKSNGIQVDEIRYAEEELEYNLDCLENIITIFIEVYNNTTKKEGVRKIIIVRNEEIIKLLNLPIDYCEILVKRNEQIGSGLSFTHRLKYSDLMKVSDAYITFD